MATQIDSLQKGVYSAMAPSGARRSSKQREMERVASERDRTGGRKVNTHTHTCSLLGFAFALCCVVLCCRIRALPAELPW